jgi:hypothetical protein
MPDERKDSMEQGIGAPPESPEALRAAEERRRRAARDPEIGGGMGGTSDAESPAEESAMNAAMSDAGDRIEEEGVGGRETGS